LNSFFDFLKSFWKNVLVVTVIAGFILKLRGANPRLLKFLVKIIIENQLVTKLR